MVGHHKCSSLGTSISPIRVGLSATIAPEHPLQDDSAWYLHHPEKTYDNINDAARNGDMDSLQKAIDKGTAVDTRDKYYKTPLMVACSVGNLKVVKFLLENG